MAADLNGDGLPEIVVPNAFGDDLSLFVNQGGGSFAAARSLRTGRHPVAVAVVDADADG